MQHHDVDAEASPKGLHQHHDAQPKAVHQHHDGVMQLWHHDGDAASSAYEVYV